MLNPYFDFTTTHNEQDLVESFLVESIQIYGMDIQYIPKTLVDYSKIFGEDPQRAFKSTYTIESYFENVTGFLGDKNFLNKLGLNIDKQATFIMTKRRFDEVILGLNFRHYWEPESTYNPNDAVHYQGLIYTNINTVAPAQVTISSIIGTYNSGDSVTGQTSLATGTVFSYNSGILVLLQVVGTFLPTETLLNNTNMSTSTVVSFTANTNIAPPTDIVNWKEMEQVRPKDGDLIYLPVTHDIFEILFADHEEVFYQLGKIYVWKLTCEKFRFSHEEIDTGISDIDSIAEELENNDSVENDPLADNEHIEHRIEDFLNLDPKAPF